MRQKISHESAVLFHYLPTDQIINPFLQFFTKNKSRLFILFLVCETLAFVFIPASMLTGSATAWPLIQFGITVAFLIIALLLRQMDDGQQYWPVFYTFFVAALAVLVSLLLVSSAQQLLGFDLSSPGGIALAKLSQSVLRLLPLLLMMGIAGNTWQSLYLHRGRLGIGLAVGAVGFIIFAIMAYAPWIEDVEMRQKLLHLTPWVFLFIFANAIEEELLFRGLFLQRYEQFLGKHSANLLTAVTFTFIHIQVTYAADILQFLVIIFPLALVWGYLMQKSNSLWGSVLFHAGADLMIIVAAFATL